MRINHGRYILTSKEQIEKALEKQNEQIALLQSQLSIVKEWADLQLEEHAPYVHASDLDLSCHKPAEMKEALAAKIQKNIWCSRCRNPWPCRHITDLRILRDLSRRFDSVDELKGFAEEMRKMPRPAASKDQIGVRL